MLYESVYPFGRTDSFEFLFDTPVRESAQCRTKHLEQTSEVKQSWVVLELLTELPSILFFWKGN